MIPTEVIAERMARLEPVAMRLEVKEGINNCVLIFNSATIVRFPKVLYLPCSIDFLRHGIIKVSVEQKNILFRIAAAAQFLRYVLLSSLRLREDNHFLRDVVLLLVFKCRA